MTNVNTYFDENKLVVIENELFNVLTETEENGRITMMVVRKIVPSREEALKIRKIIRNSGFDKDCSFSKNIRHSYIEEKDITEYVIVAIHHFKD